MHMELCVQSYVKQSKQKLRITQSKSGRLTNIKSSLMLKKGSERNIRGSATICSKENFI